MGKGYRKPTASVYRLFLGANLPLSFSLFLAGVQFSFPLSSLSVEVLEEGDQSFSVANHPRTVSVALLPTTMPRMGKGVQHCLLGNSFVVNQISENLWSLLLVQPSKGRVDGSRSYDDAEDG